MARNIISAVAAILLTTLAASPANALYEGLQCVPYARQVSGIAIYGDAHTWWDQAAGHYARGNVPRRGAVLAFIPHGAMRLGHVAAVSRVVDDRTILVRHANWSLIDGMRGHIEDDVRVIDVSPANDWTRVRVWFAPLGDLGTTEWPTHGFIYPGGSSAPVTPRLTFARADIARGDPARSPSRQLFGRKFLVAIDGVAQREQRPVSTPRLSYARLSPTTDVVMTRPMRARLNPQMGQ